MNTGQIIRSRSTDKYVSIPNTIAQGKGLTLGERGLMLYLLSLPSDWVVNKSNLHDLVSEKKGTVDTIFKGLQLKGFVVSAKVVDENGRFKGWNHIVYDEPVLSDSENHRNRFLPKSEITDIGKSAPIQKTNLKGLQRTKEITKPIVENFEEKSEETVPAFVEADRQRAREAVIQSGDLYVQIKELGEDLKNDKITCEILCMHNGILIISQLHQLIDIFCDKLVISGEPKNRVGFRSYFNNWLPLNLDKVVPKKTEHKMVY